MKRIGDSRKYYIRDYETDDLHGVTLKMWEDAEASFKGPFKGEIKFYGTAGNMKQIGDSKHTGIQEYDINQIDFGTTMSETFEQYITRIETEIDMWMAVKGKLSDNLFHIIMDIFGGIVLNPNSTKHAAVTNLLSNYHKRNVYAEDYLKLYGLVYDRIKLKMLHYDGERKERILPE